MNSGSSQWLDQQTDRLLATQGRNVETSRLVVTFSSGIGATLVAAALQEGFTPGLWWGIGGTAVAVLMAAVVFLLCDQLVQPDHGAVLEDRSLVDDAAVLAELRGAAFYAIRLNEPWVRRSRVLATVQLVMSLAAWTASVFWLVNLPKS